MSANRSGSILAVDFGNVHTRAVLIDLVDGVYHMVAQSIGKTTAGFPVGDVSVGLQRVSQNLTYATGRNLFSPDGRIITPEQPDRSGVDFFVTTASIGRPLRSVLVGLVPDVSLASGMRAVAGTYVDVVETLSLDDVRSEEEQLNAIITSHPDLIFITGGVDYGAKEPVLILARIVRMALQLMVDTHKPVILYAGNSVLVPQIRSMFDGLAPLLLTGNIRPSFDEEELEGAQLQLALAFDESTATRGTGFDIVGEMSRLGILPTAQSYNLIIEYLGQASDKNGVLAVDIGSAVSTLSASLNGRVTTSIRTDIGVGHSARSLVDVVSVEVVREWLPFYASADEITAYAFNKMLRPSTIPETLRELYLEYALLRAAIQTLLKASRPAWKEKGGTLDGRGLLPPFEMIIGAGASLTQSGRPGYNALLLLDALAPVGITELYTDPYALIPALGALVHLNPEAVVQVFETGGLELLATAFSVSGYPRLGKPAMRVKITHASGSVVTHEVNGGHLWVYHIPVGTRVTVEVRALGRGVSIGGKRRVRFETRGSAVGLVFDGRGRPLPLAIQARDRAAQMPLWLGEITGDDIHEINPEWLVVPVETPEEVPAKAQKKEKATKPRRGKAEKAPKEPKAAKGKKPLKQLDQPEEDLPEPEMGDELDELRNILP